MQHILIDYENIQPKNFDGVDVNNCHIWLFLGVNQQKSLPLELVETLLQFDNKHVHIIKMQNSGKNALDFYLSFYLGKISELDKQASVCILAKDSGYDVLVTHLNSVYDGMNIIRLANPDNVSVIDEIGTDVTTQAVTKIQQQVIKEEGEPTLDVISDIKKELKEDISKPFIHHCYGLVCAELIKENAFLPTYKHNLLSAIKKYILASEMTNYDEDEQNYIIEGIFDKLVNYGLITIENGSNQLTYHVDSKAILELIVQYVLNNQVKTIDELHNMIRQRLKIYQQQEDESNVGLIIKWLKKEGIIKQSQKDIYYPSIQYDYDDLYVNSLHIIKDMPDKIRPKKKDSLRNFLESRLKISDVMLLDKILKEFITNKLIMVAANNKISYNL
ncbi:PIN domain-containing protein [Psychrobacter sp. I-STPA10]|uniref:PIN domain-containing protein n=1 Tax=Psychrobacter sp. I-STPA10 TaxID=2585769 RepID=UPI001E3F9E63|nr:PIN domain-containing protein [Psychrobacter sp. I-STPA10]